MALKCRQNYLEKIIQSKSNLIEDVPDGSLRITHTRKKASYYLYSSENKKYTYISRCEKKLLKAIAQMEYDKKVMTRASYEYKLITKLRDYYIEDDVDRIYEKMNCDRQCLVEPICVPEDQFVSKWQDQSYIRKALDENIPEYYTSKGEQVRSKSEILIADALDRKGIPYRYEYPIRMGDRYLHPDFMVLNIRKRKEILWEHMGMMGDENYTESAVERINLYTNYGFFPGDNIIFTYETRQNPLSTRIIDKMICRFLL